MCQPINQELVTKMEERLQKTFPHANFEIDDGADGMHLHVNVTTNEFNGKTLMDQHKMVYAAFTDLITSGELHSITIKTSTS